MARKNPSIARTLFSPRGKEPYYLGDRAIRNFEELKDNLDAFTEKEAVWLASWIDYLGDGATAKKIRRKPVGFKKIISRRYSQLKKAE